MSKMSGPNGISTVGVVDDFNQWLPILSVEEGVEAGKQIRNIS